MSEKSGIDEFIRDLMPNATEEERKLAAENLDDYVRILMRIAERLEASERSAIRKNLDSSV